MGGPDGSQSYRSNSEGLFATLSPRAQRELQEHQEERLKMISKIQASSCGDRRPLSDVDSSRRTYLYRPPPAHHHPRDPACHAIGDDRDLGASVSCSARFGCSITRVTLS
jgi:hypothetical protein